MLNDLQKNHLRLGMKKDDVEFILGKPDRILAKHEVSGGGKDILLYWHYQLPVDNGSYDSTVFCVGFNNHNSIVYMKTLQN